MKTVTRARNQSRRPASLRTGTTTPLQVMKTSLALGISTAMLMPLSAGAAEQKPADTTLRTVKVQNTAIDPNPNAEPGVPYKAKTSGDARHTRPLAETPQTITVITKAAIDESGSTDLRQILDAQPGITLGTGENGNAFGDRYIIRGQEARSDVFVDGLRDPGMTIRESFAIEQLEITKGPNSSFAGRGSAGGAVNAITKQATRDFNFVKLSGGIGSDDYNRFTVDANQVLGDQFAVRANGLFATEDVPDREPADRERKGVALSGLYTPTQNLSIVLDYYGLRAEDTPDIGTYLINRRPNKNVPVYLQNPDFLESDVDTFTARISYDFSDNVRLTNLTRSGNTDNGYVVTGARYATTHVTNPTGVYPTATLSTHNAWQDVDYFANQTNLYITQELAGMKHEFIVGLEYTDHEVRKGNYAINNAGATNCITDRVNRNTGAITPADSYCMTDASGNVVAGLNSLLGRDISKGGWTNDWSTETTSIYLMDTVDLTDHWTAFAGVRYDRFDYALRTVNFATREETGDYDYSDSLWNGHFGLTYKINPMGMVYASYGTAQDINGGESDVGTSSGYGGLVTFNGSAAGADPEKSENLEIGTKWNLFDDRLLLTGAVFQVTKSDVMEGADYNSVGTFNTGKNRVRGIEIGATGELFDVLTIQAGYTLMDSEVLDSATPENEGKQLANFAQNSSFLQLKYHVTEDFALGTTMRYEGKRYGGQPDTAAPFDATTGQYNVPIPSYTVYDLFATYRISKELDARLNIGNVTDEQYYLAAYRGSNFMYLGDAQNVRVTLNYEFH